MSAESSLASIASRFSLPWSAYVQLLSVKNTKAASPSPFFIRQRCLLPSALAHQHYTIAVAPQNTIALNRKAKREYSLEERFEAGLALEGWELKSLRAGKAQVAGSYVLMRGGEAWLLGAQITPLSDAAGHRPPPQPERTRKLLLGRRELARIDNATRQKGCTCVCTALYWKKHLVKCEIALARGKQLHDKREDEKKRDWEREQQRHLRRRRD